MARRDQRRRTRAYGLEIREIPQNVPVLFSSFAGGLRLDDDKANVPDNSSPDALDVELGENDLLQRVPGIVAIENFSPRDPRDLFSHPSLDGSTELVMFDPPYMGVKQGNDPTVWTDVSLPNGDAWSTAVHGDALIFSNGGQAVFYRLPGAFGIASTGFEPARAVASWAGRIWALGGVIGGVSNPLGLRWSGASGEVTDTAGLGSGFELLLTDMNEGDRGVALQPMGFGMMAILLRKSIWVARYTGDPYRPGDLSPVISGVGAVSAATVQAVHNGAVILLSDSGVEIFDGNSVQHLSQPIDAEILPLDYARINDYGAVYSPLRMEYKLFTPAGTYTFSFKYKHWLKSSARPSRAVALYNPALMDLTTNPAGWGLYWNGAWGSNIVVSNSVLSDLVYLKGTEIGVSDQTASTFFGLAANPYWTTKLLNPGSFDALFTTKRVEVQHAGSTGTVQILVPDDEGECIRLLGSITLDSARKVQKLDSLLTGAGLAVKIRFTHGDPQIRQLRVVGEPRSRIARL
jgi:hypothetical protein